MVALVALEETTLAELLVVTAGGWVLEYDVAVEAGGDDAVLEALSQSKMMEGMAKSQPSFSGSLGCSGKTMVTSVAPPHWELSTTVPSLLQADRCLQLEPSGMV